MAESVRSVRRILSAIAAAMLAVLLTAPLVSASRVHAAPLTSEERAASKDS